MAVKFAGYANDTLRLQFDGGEVYEYYLVPPDVARQAEVALAGEEGAFFRTQVKGVYPFKRVS